MVDCDLMSGLYDQDLVLWTEEQARELRVAANAGWNAPIDWENVAEEIESWANPNAVPSPAILPT